MIKTIDEAKNHLSKHWRRYLIATILGGLFGLIYMIKCFGIDDTIKYTTWLAQLLLIPGIVYSARQLNLYKRDYRVRNQRANKEKAVELARFYATDVVPRSAYINKAFEAIGLLAEIKQVKYGDLYHFDWQEFSELYGDKPLDLTIFLDKVNEITLRPARAQLRLTPGLLCPADSSPQEELLCMVQDTMNQLEYFAMSFICGIADEKAVYQSLHQTYTRIVETLHPFIALSNDKLGKDKYYTNLIRLYGTWKKRDYDLGKELLHEDVELAMKRRARERKAREGFFETAAVEE